MTPYFWGGNLDLSPLSHAVKRFTFYLAEMRPCNTRIITRGLSRTIRRHIHPTFRPREQVDSKVLKNFGGVDDAQFLNEIKKERPYFAVLAEKASETVDSILLSRSSTKEETPSQTGVAKPRVSSCCGFA